MLRIFIVISLLTSSAFAKDDGIEIEQLPVTGVMLVEKTDALTGRVTIKAVSLNARFEFSGKITDRWSGEEVGSLEDAKYAFNHIGFKALDFKPKQIATFSVGSGDRHVTLFVDPNCPYCHKILKQLVLDSQVYRYDIVTVGLLGEASRKREKLLSCAKDRAKALSVLLSNDYSIPLEQEETCEFTGTSKRMLVAQLLGIQGVPFTVRDDGLVLRGAPRVPFSTWLEKGR